MRNAILDTYQLTLKNGWFWQCKENMSPWKVFSQNHFDNMDILWLVFRVHKLCGAKYGYFLNNDNFDTIDFTPDGIVVTDIVHAQAFRAKKTGKFITITKLQQIRDKVYFLNYMDLLLND